MKSHKNAGSCVLLALCLVFTPTVGVGQDVPAHVDEGTDKMNDSADTIFALKAAQDTTAEMQFGHLAVNKGSDPTVKAFGERLVGDQTAPNEQLQKIAKQQNMTLPTAMNAKDQAEYDKLKDLSGPQFDQAYVKAIVKDCEGAVKEFEKEARKGRNQEWKNFASLTLPVLQSHLNDAKSLNHS